MDPISTLTASAYPNTLNGFDELAVAARFGTKLFDMQQSDGITFLRALVFVDRRRHHGTNDGDAYTYAMGLSISDTADYFPDEPEPKHIADVCYRNENFAAELEAGVPTTEWTCAPECPAAARANAGDELADDMAWFVLATGVQPSEYQQLTAAQRQAFVRQSKRLKEEMRTS